MRDVNYSFSIPAGGARPCKTQQVSVLSWNYSENWTKRSLCNVVWRAVESETRVVTGHRDWLLAVCACARVHTRAERRTSPNVAEATNCVPWREAVSEIAAIRRPSVGVDRSGQCRFFPGFTPILMVARQITRQPNCAKFVSRNRRWTDVEWRGGGSMKEILIALCAILAGESTRFPPAFSLRIFSSLLSRCGFIILRPVVPDSFCRRQYRSDAHFLLECFFVW